MLELNPRAGIATELKRFKPRPAKAREEPPARPE